jgi:N-acetylglucosamine-6-phosphate deacetylase
MRKSGSRGETAIFERYSDIWAQVVSESLLVIDAGAILTPLDRFSPGRILVRGTRVEAVGTVSDIRIPEGAARFEAPALTVVPGFIDPHVHGCSGFDVMDATPQSMDIISKTLARYGTTAFLPTTVSAPLDVLSSSVQRIGGLLRTRFRGATPLGIHLEGPFLNVQKRGTHQQANVRLPDPLLLKSWIELSGATIRLITMAPELEGSQTAAEVAGEHAVAVAMGHSDASYAQASAAADSGTHYAVHTFNAMRPFTHRDPGIVGAVLLDDRIFAEIIADGVHVAPEVVRLFAKAKGASRILLATDATSATAMPDGDYTLGCGHVQMRNGVCRDEEGRLAGSTLTQDRALRNLLHWTGLPLNEAIFALTINPAAALALDGRGKIEPGAAADFALLDSNLEIARTYVAGAVVFDRSP